MKLVSSAATFSVVGEFSFLSFAMLASPGRKFTYHAFIRYTLFDKRPPCRGWETPVTKWNELKSGLGRERMENELKAKRNWLQDEKRSRILKKKKSFFSEKNEVFFLMFSSGLRPVFIWRLWRELKAFTRYFVVCKFAFYFVSYFLWSRRNSQWKKIDCALKSEQKTE